VAALAALGFTVERIGQESRAGLWQKVASRLHDDETARALRFEADLVAAHPKLYLLLLVEVKSRNADSPNIAIEKACHENALAERHRGVRVAYWLPGDRMEWPEYVPIFRQVVDPKDLAEAKRKGGSGTPFVLVHDFAVKTPYTTFIGALLWPKQQAPTQVQGRLW